LYRVLFAFVKAEISPVSGIEFRFENRNFLKNGHKKECYPVIVCWVHNWRECPKTIEVVELRKEAEKIRRSGDRA
jgi:hypothetical protein